MEAPTDLYKVVVIGGGIMGVCTAWALSKSNNAEVTLLDSCEIPRKFGGASNDYNKAIRFPYGSQEGYMIMVSDAYKAWEELFTDLGVTHYTETGVLSVMSDYPKSKLINEGSSLAADKSNWVIESYHAMKKHEKTIGTTAEFVKKEDLKGYHPYINIEDLEYGIYTNVGGVLHAADILSDTIHWLKTQSNCKVFEGSKYEVISWESMHNGQIEDEGSIIGSFYENIDPNTSVKASPNESKQYKVLTKGGQVFYADKLAVCIGIHTEKLLPEVRDNKQLIPSRQQFAYYSFNPESLKGWEKYPLITENNAQSSFYMMPIQGGKGTPGIKASDRRFTLDSDYDHDDFLPHNGFNNPTIDWLKHRFIPSAVEGLRVVEDKVCYYDLSPGEIHQFYDFSSNHSAVSVFGFTGHGFKFGAIYGKAISDALLGRKSFQIVKEWFMGKTMKTFDQL